MGDIAKYFDSSEMMCKCGCKECRMAKSFMDRLDGLRWAYNKPLIVNSGYRCPSHNARVSRKTGEDGPHTRGHAVDLRVSGHDAYTIVRLATALGFTGIGVAQSGTGRYIHLDDLTDHPYRPWIWSY